MRDPWYWLDRKWCPHCHVPLRLVRSVTLKNDCTKFVCLSCHQCYSELRREAERLTEREAAL